MLYLASPYSHPDPLIVRTRFLLAEQCCASLISKGQFVWSPIVHFHEMSLKYHLPSDAEYWKRNNFDFIRRADAILVLKIDGWDRSKGVTMELDLAKELNLPILWVDENGEEL